MKVYKTNEIKNIAVIGNAGSGKTTLAEAMLFECGLIKRRGSVDGKNSESDYFPVEKEYAYSVFSTVFSYEWKDKLMNFSDCPASDDFVGGVISALHLTAMALMLIDAANGVEVGTVNQFRYVDVMNEYGWLPHLEVYLEDIDRVMHEEDYAEAAKIKELRDTAPAAAE